jgi:HEPN domain-containing protein
MIDIDKQIAYWRRGAQEDWIVARELVDSGRIRHGLFFAHLALEKALKAHVCRRTRDLAPRIHNLVRLAELAGITPSQDQIDVLAEANAFSIEGRYPELLTPPPTPTQAQTYIARAKEVFQWLMRLL